MYLNDLPSLIDISDKIIFYEEPLLFDEETTHQLIELCYHLIDEYLSDNPSALMQEDFYYELSEQMINILSIHFEPLCKTDEELDILIDLIEEICILYTNSFLVDRSDFKNETYPLSNFEISGLTEKIEYLRNVPQPEQRTEEWYERRHNLITASNAYKAFERENTLNQLIYEKCKPICEFTNNINLNSPLHWGQKYEPVSVLIYEYINNTKVEDFGCIPHKEHSFLGASPDGIITDETSDKFGRMLEIKNIVNREITGIPKKEYWVQMQLQMEVCDLDYCDFLETKFTELNSYTDFCNDDSEFKGVILYFSTKEMKPNYIYMPLSITILSDIDKWIEESIEEHSCESNQWIKTIYWKLEKKSCVLVERNKEWFLKNINQLENVWNIILKERKFGYEHRAPKKTNRISRPKESINQTSCLINIIKINTEVK